MSEFMRTTGEILVASMSLAYHYHHAKGCISYVRNHAAEAPQGRQAHSRGSGQASRRSRHNRQQLGERTPLHFARDGETHQIRLDVTKSDYDIDNTDGAAYAVPVRYGIAIAKRLTQTGDCNE